MPDKNNNNQRNARNDQPNKEYKIITVALKIIDVKTDRVEQKKIKIIDDAERREWIVKNVMYAVMNGKYVEIINNEDDAE